MVGQAPAPVIPGFASPGYRKFKPPSPAPIVLLRGARSEAKCIRCTVRGSGRVQAMDCGAPEGRSAFAAELILYPLFLGRRLWWAQCLVGRVEVEPTT